MQSLTDRVALVTGGSRGIGRAACLALAESGAAVAVHYNTSQQAADALVQTITGMGGRAIALGDDLSDAGAPDRMAAKTAELLGPIDILVNNAAVLTSSSVAEMPDVVWEQTLTVNLTAAFRCVRACIPSMQRRGWGRIINVSSQAAYTGSATHAHYAAAKAGVMGLTYSLAKELGPFGITVNAIVPGRIDTDMLADDLPKRHDEWMRQTPLRRLGRPEEVAAAIAFLASEAASYITGAALQVGGGLVMG